MPPLTPQEIRTNQIATTHALFAGYTTWSISAILAPRAPNCTHQVLPARLDRPSSTNEAYRDSFSQMMPLFQDFTVHVIKASHDPFTTPPTSGIHVRSTATTVLGEYNNEYSFFLAFTEDGTQLTRIEEFVDSGYSTEFFQKLRAKIAEGGGGGKGSG